MWSGDEPHPRWISSWNVDVRCDQQSSLTYFCCMLQLLTWRTSSPPSLSQNVTLETRVPQKLLFVYPANKVQQNLGPQRSSDQAGTWWIYSWNAQKSNSDLISERAVVTMSATAKNRCFSCKRRRHPSGQAVAIQKQEWPPCIHIAGQATGNVKMSEGKKIASRPRVGSMNRRP
ncbi:hypothetical protein BJX66DRAFT_234864 [Aspergillus keveii]|uniref:Uncharacterized protein n=1 Tax=Aspergillus keveii TaxID=714993 RepID=A0ABR4G1S9_9EURO